MMKNTGKIGKYGFFTNLALFYDDVSMTSLVGHGDVTSADVIGEDVAEDDRSTEEGRKWNRDSHG